MESQPQNPEFRNNPEKFHPCILRGYRLEFKNNNLSQKIDFVLENSAGADEMPPYVVFHLSLHCLPKYPLTVSCLKWNKQFANILLSINFNTCLGA